MGAGWLIPKYSIGKIFIFFFFFWLRYKGREHEHVISDTVLEILIPLLTRNMWFWSKDMRASNVLLTWFHVCSKCDSIDLDLPKMRWFLRVSILLAPDFNSCITWNENRSIGSKPDLRFSSLLEVVSNDWYDIDKDVWMNLLEFDRHWCVKL